MKRKSTYVILTFLISFQLHAFSQSDFSILSPDNNINIKINISNKVSYSVNFGGIEIIHPSPISMELEGDEILGINPKIKNTNIVEINKKIIPVVPEKRSVVIDHYNEITINFKGNYNLKFRAYNDGVAYRWATDKKGEIVVKNEIASFGLSAFDSLYFPEEESFLTHSERKYPFLAVSDISCQQMSCMPVLICRTDGIRIAISESDLLDYPGMYITGSKAHDFMLVSKFPPYPLEENQVSDRTIKVEKAADFIAKTSGSRDFPWRLMIITDNDAGLIESDMVYRLGSPNQLDDCAWIKPGKVAWDWWNALNITGVDFESGVNTKTYKYFIDFAAAYNIPYIILDEGWSDTEDLFAINPDIDIKELFAYAEKKEVGIILWVVWCTLENQLREALTQFEAWGAKGIKVDFMQRDDQKMVNYYEAIACEAAKHKLMVDFHGSYKSTGLRRTYPNVMTREGVHGLENNKWAESVTPEHDVTLPFTRMLAGPMDYTPGAMLNCTEKQFKAVFSRPMSQGTRCHQLAMYVVYESPLQMLADSPSNYYKEPESMDFLKVVPVTWDETKVLEAKVGDYLVVARKKAEKWYLGAMTDWSPREIDINLSFIEEGEKLISIWQDGVNADKNPQDIKVSSKSVAKTDTIIIKLAPGGGWVAIIE